MPKAVIFDVDGTLIDSVDLHARAWQDAFRKWGKEVPFAAVRSQIGKGGDQLLPEFFSKEELKRFGDELSEWRSAHFLEHYFPKANAFARVRELFERLLADGKQVALASSARKDELSRYEKLARIEDLVQVETSQDDAEKSKPHPDIFEAALRRLNVVAHDAIAVGDSPFDAIACGRAGLRIVGVRCGGFPEAELRGAGCEQLFDNPADLLARYGDWASASASSRRPR